MNITINIRGRLGLLLACACACLILWPASGVAETAEDRLDQKQSALDQAQQREGVQSQTLETLSEKVDALTAKVADIRNREATVQAELDEVEARLDAATAELEIARERLRRAMAELRQRLVTIYKQGQPDVLTVLLNSDGFDQLLGRTEYLGAIQTQGESVTDQVRELRDQKRATVKSIESARAAIAAKEAELKQSRLALEAQESRLAKAQADQRAALAKTRTNVGELQDDVGKLEDQVQAEIQAAQEAAAAPTTPAPAVGPVQQEESGSGLIWPVQGTVTSPFGFRWGRMHEGIDIGAAEGTPIQAAQSGTVIMASYNGGYGNYTCIDHGGGFSTCYAHQSLIGVSVGQEVSQGDVIGEVGNTGASFGAHLHFETRNDGVAADPFGYL